MVVLAPDPHLVEVSLAGDVRGPEDESESGSGSESESEGAEPPDETPAAPAASGASTVVAAGETPWGEVATAPTPVVVLSSDPSLEDPASPSVWEPATANKPLAPLTAARIAGYDLDLAVIVQLPAQDLLR